MTQIVVRHFSDRKKPCLMLEEAIKMLKYNSNVIHQTMDGRTDPKEVEALDLAIQALEAQRNLTNEELYQSFIGLEAENERLHDALEAQPCEDCISREAVIKNIKQWFDKIELNPDILIDSIITLPPVYPERPKGKWIWDLRMGLHKCSVCGKFCDFDYLYCPNCGSYNGGGEG